jgi:hypothetical protein
MSSPGNDRLVRDPIHEADVIAHPNGDQRDHQDDHEVMHVLFHRLTLRSNLRERLTSGGLQVRSCKEAAHASLLLSFEESKKQKRRLRSELIEKAQSGAKSNKKSEEKIFYECMISHSPVSRTWRNFRFGREGTAASASGDTRSRIAFRSTD